VLGGGPIGVFSGEEEKDIEGEEGEDREGEEGGVDEEGGGGGEGEEEGGEGFGEVPVAALGVVIDHDAGEDGGEEGGDGGEFGRGEDGVLEGKVGKEGEGGENEGDGGDEGEGEDFAGEPGGFEAEEEAPGFERFSEVEGGGDHAGVADLGEDEHEGEGPVSGLGGELGLVGGGGDVWSGCAGEEVVFFE